MAAWFPPPQAASATSAGTSGKDRPALMPAAAVRHRPTILGGGPYNSEYSPLELRFSKGRRG